MLQNKTCVIFGNSVAFIRQKLWLMHKTTIFCITT